MTDWLKSLISFRKSSILEFPLNGTGVDSAAHEVGSRPLLEAIDFNFRRRKNKGGRAGGIPNF